MSDTPESVRLWLVERDYDDRNMITLVYATPAGDRTLVREQSATVMHRQGTEVTAAIDADPASLEPVDDAETRERHADEAARMAERYDPDEAV
jgi:hypothetical protein